MGTNTSKSVDSKEWHRIRRVALSMDYGAPPSKQARCVIGIEFEDQDEGEAGARVAEEETTITEARHEHRRDHDDNAIVVEEKAIWTDIDIVTHILKYMGGKSYRFTAPISRTFHQGYKRVCNSNSTTFKMASTTVAWASLWFDECKSSKAVLCQYSAQGGHLGVLQWARANGCLWNEHTCSYAAQGGHLDVLQWARENGCPWNEWTCSFAAHGGHIDVLQWASANGCPLNEWTCVYAARQGHLDVLQWARENGCPEK